MSLSVSQGRDPNSSTTPSGYMDIRLRDAADGSGTGYAMETQPAGESSRSTAGPPGVGQTGTTYSNKVALSGVNQTINLLTVPTGKTFYLTDCIICFDGATVTEFQVQNSATVIFFCPSRDIASFIAPGIETQPTVPAGNIVQLFIPAGAGNVRYYLAGYYQ